MNRVAAEVRSASNYQGLAQLLSLQHLLDDAKASVLILQCRFDDAIDAIERVLSASTPVSPSGHSVTTLCDAALCYANLGRTEDFERTLERIEPSSLESCKADDRAVAYGALRSGAVLMGRDREAAEHERQMKQNIEQHRASIDSLRKVLEPFIDVRFAD